MVDEAGTIRVTLNLSTLYVGGRTVPSNDKRLKSNQRQPVEYNTTHYPTTTYTTDTPQSHQCGFIAHSVQQTEKLKYAVVGGAVQTDGQESIKHENYNAVFIYAVEATQELPEVL